MKQFRFLVPALTFAVIAIGLLYALFFLNPKEIPSALIAKPVPVFALDPVPGFEKGLSSDDLKKGKITLVNVFASWCVACVAEHPVLMDFKNRNLVDLYGLNYKNKPDAAQKWLAKHGNPYAQAGMDLNGRVGIDFGVYGVPETFVIDGQGKIIHKIIGPVRPETVEDVLIPLIESLKK